ncbi:MAG: ribosome recycling factor [Christensenellaceae bacterium]|jgi:ribosome recycling factor|nr:ribosome recycling factor [Christensenellaceae bacterium]
MIENYSKVLDDFEDKLNKRTDRLSQEYSIIRAGRANPKILDKIFVDYYGTPTPIGQMANITVPEARMITISPWDISLVKEVTKAIQSSDLGVNPSDDGRIIRLTFPALTEERRKEIVKEVKKICEDAKIGIRNDRHDVLEFFKKAEKDKEMSKDEITKAEADVKKLMDKYNSEADELCLKKEKEVLSV